MVSSVVGGFERYSSLKSFKSAILEFVIRLLIVVSLEYCVPPSFVRSVEVFWFVGAAVRVFCSPSGRFGELFIFEAGPVSGLICAVCDLLSGSVILEIHEALIPISTRLLQ